MKRSTILLLLLSLFCCICIDAPISSAQIDDKKLVKVKPGEPVIVDGDKVEFFEEGKRITAEGNVKITYGDVKLFCDSIEVDTQAQKAACKGNVRIEHPDGVLTGDYIVYDLLNKKGEIITAEVKAFPWFGYSEETKRVQENEYLLKKGFFTTCDLDEPHYRIAAEEIRIFPDEKIIAKNAVFYIGKVPVLWFPYYYHPIIQTKSKVQFIFGNSSDWGYFVLSAWRFHIKGNSKVDVLLDYRTKKGFAEGANLYYYLSDFGLDGLGEGLFRAYFAHQNDKGTYDRSAFREDEGTDPELRQRFQWMHRMDFNPTTVGMLEFNKVSDKYVSKDYFYNEYEENNQVPANYFSIVSAQTNYMVTLEYNQRFNDFYTVTQKRPEVKLDIPDQRLWHTPFYYSSVMSGTSFEKEFADDSEPSQETQRFDTFHKLSYAGKLGFLNITPFGSIRETVYSKNKWGDDFIARTAFGGGVGVFSRFHRIFDVETDFMGLDINALRHIIVPRAEYNHLHQPTVDKDSLFQMDDLDALEKENTVTLSLENKLQTKRHYGEGLGTVDLVRFIVSTDYSFRMEKDEFKFEKEGKFEKISFDLEMKPYDWIYIDSEMEVLPKNQSISTGSVELSLFPNERFNLNAGYRYEKKPDDPRNQLVLDLSYVLNPKWRFGLYERFDFHEGKIEEQQFTIVRDLHCWEVEVTYDVDGEDLFKDDFTLWIAFRIKAFPDLQLGLDRNYTKQPAGASMRR